MINVKWGDKTIVEPGYRGFDTSRLNFTMTRTFFSRTPVTPAAGDILKAPGIFSQLGHSHELGYPPRLEHLPFGTFPYTESYNQATVLQYLETIVTTNGPDDDHA